MGDERSNNKTVSALSSMILIGVGILAGWMINSRVTESRRPQEAYLQVNITRPRIIDYPNQCAICLETFEMNQRITVLACSHQFHLECFDGILGTRCPVCRSHFE